MWKLWIVMVLVLVASAAVGEELNGLVHSHSAYSDGDRTSAMLRNALKKTDTDFFVITDHIEQIDVVTTEKKVTGQFGDFVGYDRYISDFTGGKPYGIIGTEVAIGKSHLLVFGEKERMKTFFDQDLTGKSLQEIIEIAKRLDLLKVAAHPFAKDYPFDTAGDPEVDGIEMFNDDGVDRYRQTLDWYLELVKKGRKVFVTSGCDSHASIDPTQNDFQRWTRKTWINCSEVSEQLILMAFCQSATVAACNGARIKLDYYPRSESRVAEKSELGCKVTFSWPVLSSKKVRIYCDGELMEGDIKTFPVGKKEMDCQWELMPGAHSYIVEVEGCIVTSPIYLEAPAVVKKEVVAKGIGYMGLLGLNFSEVVSKMKKQPDYTWPANTSEWFRLGWGYNDKPVRGYTLHLHYDHYRNLGCNETFEVVHSINTTCRDEKNAVPPQKIVPADILASKPQKILWARDNDLVIMWVKDGLTYFLGLTDSRRKLVEQRKVLNSKGALIDKFYLSEAGENFRGCNQTLFFVCVDCEFDPFAPNGNIKSPSDPWGYVDYDPLGSSVREFDR